MKITVFNGSPHAERSNTNVMAEAFLEGARAVGAEVENIFLAHKKIHSCVACYSCWLKTPGQCAVQDDMTELLPKCQASDIVIFATPLYVDNVTGLMKNFMDRMIPAADPYFEKDPGGECRHKITSKVPKIMVISNCGFPEQSHFQVLKLLFRRIARNMNTELIAEIYRGGGSILSDKSFWLWLPLRHYKALLRRAGEEVVTNGGISAELQRDLEKPLMPEEQYIKGAESFFRKELKKIGR
ncbi:MAG: flavodoxin family protein [Candidatus Omnitrophota bacterium]